MQTASRIAAITTSRGHITLIRMRRVNTVIDIAIWVLLGRSLQLSIGHIDASVIRYGKSGAF